MAGTDNESDDASQATNAQQQPNIQPQIITTVSNNNAKFSYLKKDEDIWNALKARFGGNVKSKKMRKSMLKQEFSEFRIGKVEEAVLQVMLENLLSWVSLLRINADVETAKKDLQTKLDNHLARTEKWRNSSKNLFKLIDSSMSVRTKVGLGFTNCIGENELGWDDFAFSVLTTNSEDVEGRPIFHRPQPVPTGKPNVSAPVPTGKPNMFIPVPTGKPKVSTPVPTGRPNR
nr:hypothetical protein [Tanacetum cinerariifolium]